MQTKINPPLKPLLKLPKLFMFEEELAGLATAAALPLGVKNLRKSPAAFCVFVSFAFLLAFFTFFSGSPTFRNVPPQLDICWAHH